MPHDEENNNGEMLSGDSHNEVSDHFFGTKEKTQQESAYVTDSLNKPFNTDDLWEKRGDYTLYEEMKIDDQIHVALQLKKDLVIGGGWSIVAQDEGQTEIVDDITSRLEEDPEVAFEDQLEDLIDNAYSFGFALSEKLFKFRDDNSLTWNEMKTRHPNSWLIHTDKHGNVEKYEQRAANGDLEINPKSLIHYINNRAFQNPYGTSDLRPAHDAWLVKRHITRYYAIFMEKHASPTPIGKYKKNVPNSKITELFNILKKFQAKTAMVIPEEFEIDFLESRSDGEAYTKGINMFNMFIGRALFVPDLLGFSGSDSGSGGSQALGREQMNVFFKHIERRRRTLERIVNKEIIQPLIWWNFGQIEKPPRFVLDTIGDEDAAQYAATFINAVQGKLYEPNDEEINHFRGLIKFPEGEVNRPAVAAPPFFRGQPGAGNEEQLSIHDDEEKLSSDEVQDAQVDVEVTDKKEFAVFKATDGPFAKKVNFQAIKRSLESSQDKLIEEAQPVINEIFMDLFTQIQKKKIISGEKAKPEKIDTIKLKKLSSLQRVIKSRLFQHYKDSKVQARNEILPNRVDFVQPLPSDEFLAFLEKETFDFIGDWEFKVNQEARIALRNAIKDGTPLSDVIAILDDKTRRAAEVSIERYARTKHTEVLNRARVEEFADSPVVDGYQYSAILDGRTTAICRGLHGKKFKKGTEPIPPMHFNCRSVLIPITIFEEFKPDTKVGKTDINTFIKDKAGEGFSKR